MRSFALIFLLMLHCSVTDAQSNRVLQRRLNLLERRCELDSSQTNENFREVWNQIDMQAEMCCPATQSKEELEYEQNDSFTIAGTENNVKELDEKISVMTKAFVNEKETVRTWMKSIEEIVTNIKLTCLAGTEQLKMETHEIKKATCTCSTEWVKIFENGPNGEVFFGERNDLIQAVLTGSSVKILADKRYVTNVQNLRPVKGHLMAQALFHVSVSNRKFQDNAYWWFVLASTTGHWYMARYNVGEHVSRGDSEIRYGIEWFIRRPCDINPALRMLPDNTIAYGSIKNVVTAVRNGYPVRITSLKNGYTFPADTLEIAGGHVAAQSIWHLSQQSSSDSTRVIFQKKAYWYFTIWATTGKKEMSRWTIGKHESRGRTSDVSSIDWFVDPCWKLVYKHGPYGDKIEGNKAELIDSVQRGHRVRIIYKDTAFQPNVILVSDNEITAFSADSVSKVSFDKFENDLSWIWRSVSTDGKPQVLKTPVGNSDNTYTDGRAQLSWFVDKRKWKRVVSITAKGEIVSGSKADLLQKVGQGADVRIGVKDSDGFTYMQPDNVRLYQQEKSLSAMHIRQAKFHPKLQPSWVFTLTNTEGVRDKSIWTLGKHEMISHIEEQVDTVWFISE